MIQHTETYMEFDIDITISHIEANFRIFTSIARCTPKLSSAIRSICDERIDWTAVDKHMALDRALRRAKKDVDYLVANGLLARI